MRVFFKYQKLLNSRELDKEKKKALHKRMIVLFFSCRCLLHMRSLCSAFGQISNSCPIHKFGLLAERQAFFEFVTILSS